MAEVTIEPIVPPPQAPKQAPLDSASVSPNPASIPLPATPVKAPARAAVPGRVSTPVATPRSPAALARARAQEMVSVARDRAAEIRRHPTAARVEAVASKQVDNAREILGRSESIRRAEKLTGVDRVPLVLIAASL